MEEFLFKINVLGTDYGVIADTQDNNVQLRNCDAYIAPEFKLIVLDKANKDRHQMKVLAHEIVHAFLYESGLDVESWAHNEEIVDWIAIQLFKINSVVKDSHKKLKPFYTKRKVTKNK